VKAAVLRLYSLIMSASVVALLAPSRTYAQPSNSVKDLDLEVRHEHALWPSPESVLRDLNSREEVVRESALFLIGLGRSQAEEAVFEQNSSSTTPKIIGQRVITVDIAELRYAALGEDTTQQAILSVQSGPMAFVAVVVPKTKAWERIASFSCWCKYEKNPLREAVSLAPLALWSATEPQRYEPRRNRRLYPRRRPLPNSQRRGASQGAFLY